MYDSLDMSSGKKSLSGVGIIGFGVDGLNISKVLMTSRGVLLDKQLYTDFSISQPCVCFAPWASDWISLPERCQPQPQ